MGRAAACSGETSAKPKKPRLFRLPSWGPGGRNGSNGEARTHSENTAGLLTGWPAGGREAVGTWEVTWRPKKEGLAPWAWPGAGDCTFPALLHNPPGDVSPSSDSDNNNNHPYQDWPRSRVSCGCDRERRGALTLTGNKERKKESKNPASALDNLLVACRRLVRGRGARSSQPALAPPHLMLQTAKLPIYFQRSSLLCIVHKIDTS
jgi:hypothetical protein